MYLIWARILFMAYDGNNRTRLSRLGWGELAAELSGSQNILTRGSVVSCLHRRLSTSEKT